MTPGVEAGVRALLCERWGRAIAAPGSGCVVQQRRRGLRAPRKRTSEQTDVACFHLSSASRRPCTEFCTEFLLSLRVTSSFSPLSDCSLSCLGGASPRT